MKSTCLILVAMSCLSGCTALVAGAAGATIANPKAAGQVVKDTGEAIRDLGSDIANSDKKKTQ